MDHLQIGAGEVDIPVDPFRAETAAENQQRRQFRIERCTESFIDLCKCLLPGQTALQELGAQGESGQLRRTFHAGRIDRGEGKGKGFRPFAHGKIGFPQPGVAIVQEKGDLPAACRQIGRDRGITAHGKERLDLMFRHDLTAEFASFESIQSKPDHPEGILTQGGCGDLIRLHTARGSDLQLFLRVLSAQQQDRLPAGGIEFLGNAQAGVEVSAGPAAGDGKFFQYFHDPETAPFFFLRFLLKKATNGSRIRSA